MDPPTGVRYATEFRFKPQPRILNQGGDIAAAFWGEPFIHWRVQSTPFRVELHNEPRSMVAALTHRNIQLEMESPDTFTVFREDPIIKTARGLN